MWAYIIQLLVLAVCSLADENETTQVPEAERRILNGKPVIEDRPFMVYLQLPSDHEHFNELQRWLCGGAVVHPEYIITSAACIEDVRNFYVVSGMLTYTPPRSRNTCWQSYRRKAIWACIPKHYSFEDHDKDNLRWMTNDIAVVRVDKPFRIGETEGDCQMPVGILRFNDFEEDLELPDRAAYVYGWGSHNKYRNTRRKNTDKRLHEAPVTIMDKARCEREWGAKYRPVIRDYMICTNNIIEDISNTCKDKYAKCKVLSDSGNGGICENDHGGPLVTWHEDNPVLIGVISATLNDEKTLACYGPFLYTSIYKNRQFLHCSINKNTQTDSTRWKREAAQCDLVFRAGQDYREYFYSWRNHPDGPAEKELTAPVMRAQEPALGPEVVRLLPIPGNDSVVDILMAKDGLVLRSHL